METSWFFLALLLPLPLLLILSRAWNKATKQRPPGPTGWPVVGNMFDLGTLPHQTMYKLRFKYGPVLWLKLGSVNTMVIQSPKAAAELFKNHDSTFCDRRVPHAVTSCDYHKGTMSLANYGPYWRTLRKLSAMEFLASKRLNDTAAVRQKCMYNMIRWIEEDSLASRACGGSGEEMFFGGSETTTSTIEWAMVELLRNPDSMKKLKEEITSVIGLCEKVEEKNLDQLSYLQAIVKETLRLHPSLPLLLPRNARHDSNYMGYHIPKNTQVLVNVWAIGRDPESWDDPMSFKPERFLGTNIDYKGQHFELIPFGSGRRMCPGFAFGHRVIQLALASLIHNFDWEVSSQAPEIMDMTERMGMTLRKLVPLKVTPTKRNSIQVTI